MTGVRERCGGATRAPGHGKRDVCRWRGRICAVSLGGWIGLSPALAAAQLASGSIGGRVTDSSGAPMPAVPVVVSAPFLVEGARQGTTDERGSYHFDHLPPGVFTLRIALDRFRAFERTGIEVAAGFAATIDVRMELGQVTDTITVQAGTPVVDLRSSVRQTVVPQHVLEQAPTGRDVWSVARLVPGVNSQFYDVGGTQGMQQSVLTVHGSRASDQTYAVDGLPVNYPAGNGGSAAAYFDQGLFEQVVFQTSALPAEVAAGGVHVNQISRSATGRWSGDLRAYYADHRLQAENFETRARSLGSAVGNPIAEQYDGNVSGGGPIRSGLASVFGSWRQWKVDKRLLSVFDADGRPAIDDNLIRSGSGRVVTRLADHHLLTVTGSVSQKDRYHRRDAPPNFVEDKASWRQASRTGIGHIRSTSSFGGRTVLELSFGGVWGSFPLRYQDSVTSSDLRREDAVLSTASGAAPREFSQQFRRHQFGLAVSRHRAGRTGLHALKAGLQTASLWADESNRVNGDVRLNFANGVATSVVATNTPVRAVSAVTHAGIFLQDAWTPHSRLTLNVGGRYDRAIGRLPAQTSGAGRWVAERHVAAQRVYDQSLAVWRAGLVVDARGDGRTAVKISASRYGQQVGLGLVGNVHPFTLSSATVAWSDANGNGLPEERELGRFEGFATGGGRYATSDGPDWSYSDEVTAGVEQQLPGGVRLDATYYHRTNRKTVGVRNVAVPASAYTPAAVSNPLGGTITVFNLDPVYLGRVDNIRENSPLLDGDYEGVEVTVSRRFRGGWQLLGGVTAGSSRTGADVGDLNDPNNLQFQRGSQLDDATWQWRAAGSWKVPLVGLDVAATWLADTGRPRQLTYLVTRAVMPTLTRASQLVRVDRRGDTRRPALRLFDLRVSREFRTRAGWRLSPQVEVFNLTNADTVVNMVDAIGPRLGLPTEILTPRTLRIGLTLGR